MGEVDQAAPASGIARFRAWYSALLFPAATPLRGRELLAVSALSVVFFLGSVLLLLFWRSAPVPGQFIWAEDGTIFLHDAALAPLGDTVLSPYAGYAHLVPRTVASFVELFPLERWPLGLAAVSAAIRAALAIFVWHATSGAIPNKWVRLVVSITVVTLPMGGYEVLNSIANLHWFLLFACVPALLWRPSSWIGVTLQCLVVLGAVLSDPLALLWSPIVLLRMIALPRPRELAVCATFIISGVLQFFTVLATNRPRAGDVGLVDLVKAYTIRVAQTSFAGIDMTTWLWQTARTAGAILTVLAIGAVLVLGLRRPGPHRGLVVCAIAASVGIYLISFGLTIPMASMTSVNATAGGIDLTFAGRYAVVAGLLLLLAFIPAWWAILAAAAGILRGVLIGCTVALVALYAVAVYQAYGVRIDAPDALAWSVSTAEARQECANPAVPTVDVPIYPQGWVLTLSCDELR